MGNVREHFDGIANKYNRAIPQHIRTRLLEKWWRTAKSYLRKGSRVLDIGCGDGTAVNFLRERGIKAFGVDFSRPLIQTGRKRSPRIAPYLVQGDALNLLFQDSSFDAVIMTGVLHHIHSRKCQAEAVREAFRVLKDSGVMIIRESNLTNPVFRFFWNYVFPLTSKIDRFGGESWVAPREFGKIFPGKIEKINYFSFLPNFTPRKLIPIAGSIENALEASRLKVLSAHYVVVLRKALMDFKKP